MDRRASLADLLRHHQDTTGESYADVARRSGLSKSKIGQIASTNPVHLARLTTIEQLAAGLRLPLLVVKAAALITAGLADYDDVETALFVAQYEQLDTRDQAAVRNLASHLHKATTRP